MKPLLRWAGGKSWIVPTMEQLYQPYKKTHRLVEMFAGGLAVTLALKPDRFLASDVNTPLIKFYQAVQSGQLDTSWLNWEPSAEYYTTIRQWFNENQRPDLFYYLNRTCFNGLWRVNRKGEFNNSYGKLAKPYYLTDFSEYRQYLNGYDKTFQDASFDQLVIKPNDFLFVDPPYDVVGGGTDHEKRSHTQYQFDRFDWPVQEYLVNWLKDLPNPMIATNLATVRIIDLYREAGFDIELCYTRRSVSASGDARTKVVEMIASKNLKRSTNVAN